MPVAAVGCIITIIVLIDKYLGLASYERMEKSCTNGIASLTAFPYHC